MMHRGCSNIIILAGVVVTVVIAGLLFLSKNGGPSTTLQNQAPTSNTRETQRNPSIAASDVCVAEKENIIDRINTFENFQMKRGKESAQGVLALFTPPEFPGDSFTYIHLSGSDTTGPRLYRNGQTDFQQSSFKILEGPEKNASGSCTTTVQEQRRYDSHDVGGNVGQAQPYTVYFVMIKEDGVWKIDSYLSDSGSTHKYSGWDY